MVTDHPEIYRCALLLVRDRGPAEAKASILRHLARALVERDLQGIARWHRMLRAADELQRLSPSAGEPVN